MYVYLDHEWVESFEWIITDEFFYCNRRKCLYSTFVFRWNTFILVRVKEWPDILQTFRLCTHSGCQALVSCLSGWNSTDFRSLLPCLCMALMRPQHAGDYSAGNYMAVVVIWLWSTLLKWMLDSEEFWHEYLARTWISKGQGNESYLARVPLSFVNNNSKALFRHIEMIHSLKSSVSSLTTEMHRLSCANILFRKSVRTTTLFMKQSSFSSEASSCGMKRIFRIVH